MKWHHSSPPPGRVFITGASSGIGAGLARHYAGPGVTIGLVARREARLRELADELEQAGARAVVLPADVADAARLREAAHEFCDVSGGADLVVANAGVGDRRPVAEMTAEDVRRVVEVNLLGTANTLVPFLGPMLAQGNGCLVAVSSMAGFRALPGHTVYCASKAAIITFMDGLRMELHGSGVHAMAFCPGFVETPMTARLTTPKPFQLELTAAVELMARAIAERQRTVVFPWQMRLLLRPLLERAPEWLLSVQRKLTERR